MEKERKSFLVYLDYEEQLSDLTDKELGLLLRAMFSYVRDGTMPSKFKGTLKLAFKFIKSNLDRDNEKWEDIKKKRSSAGKKGMENRWKGDNKITNDNKKYQTITNITDNVSVNENVNVNVNESESVINNTGDVRKVSDYDTPPTVTGKVSDYSTAAPSTPPPPTLTEISEYCQTKGYSGFDYEKFYDYYEATSWLDKNGNPVKSWKAKLRYWYKQDENEGKLKKDCENVDTETIFDERGTGRLFQYDSEGNKHYVDD